ncbi:MAG TPA: hypothetical protein PK867_27350 [Pirellulales bacterium]|nr:hypothetical protein [Pirellulales bacterium]
MRLPAELDPASVVALVDSREQHPFDLAPLASITGTLATGDYSIRGLEQHVAIERKSLPDLLGCIGQDRERFDKEIVRLLAYPCRAVVVEASWSDLERGDWRSKVTPQAATGSVLGWIAQGVPFLFCGSREAAAKATSRMLYITARRHWRIARSLVGSVERLEAVA